MPKGFSFHDREEAKRVPIREVHNNADMAMKSMAEEAPYQHRYSFPFIYLCVFFPVSSLFSSFPCVFLITLSLDHNMKRDLVAPK